MWTFLKCPASTCNLDFLSYNHEAFLTYSQVDVIYTDFKKAFDRVDHSNLLRVLISVDFGNPLLTWFRSYLLDSRKQWLSIWGIFSSSGVQQGVVLSSLLFSLFVNSANSVSRYVKLLNFADDMKI